MWLDDAVPEGELATQRKRLQFTSELPEPGFWQGSLDVVGPNLLRGGLEAGVAFESGFTSIWEGALDSAAGMLLPEPKFGGDVSVTEAERSQQETIGQGLAQDVISLRPDPNTTGIAGQIIGEASAILPRAIVATGLAGPVAGAVAAGGPAGYASKQVGMVEGLDESTATLKGVIDSATVGFGALLPAARFVKPVVGDFGIAVGANVALGAAGRGATAELLEGGGYHEQAAQYRVMDGAALATDAILGAAFFGIGRMGGVRPTAQQVDAALTERNAQHADVDTAPGVPVDPLSAAIHQNALDTATSQLARGEPVRIDEVDGATFLRKEGDGPVAQELARVQEQQARADVRADGDDFAARVGRESVYDDAGTPVFRDGTAYPLSEVPRFFDTHVAGTEPKDGAPMPDVLFSIGQVDAATAQGLHQFLPGFHDGLSEARISARTIKHIQDSRPAIVREVLDRLERGVLQADEVLPNHQNPERALLVLRDVGGAERSGSAKHQSTVVEISVNGKGVDVVSAMTMPERSLNKARALKAELEASRAGGLHPPSSLAAGRTQQPHAAAASEDFPTVARDSASIRPDDGGATDPVVRVADEILAMSEDIQLPTGAIDADGNPVTVSARQMLADADAEIATAQQEGNGFLAAAACFLQRGE